MRTTRLLPLAASLAVCLLLATAHSALAQGEAGFVTGTITDSATGQPIEAAIMLVKGTLLRASSNARGEYQLFPVPSGPQTLTVTAIGHQSESRALTVLSGGTVQASFTLGLQMVELPGLVVTASRGEEQQEESPISIAVINSRELVERNITTIDEALPFVPGVTFNNDDIAIRGSTGVANGVGSRVLLLLDGHPVLTGDGGEVDFEEIPLLDLERVEVVKGAYSALYGSNALGGVVNLITAPISETPATLVRLHFGMYQIPARYKFTDDHLTSEGFGLQHSREIGKVGVRLFAGRESTDGFTDNGRSTRWLLRAKLGSAPGAAHPWDAYAIWAREIDYSFFRWQSADHPFQLYTDTLPGSSAVGDNERARKFLLGGSVEPLVRAHTLVRVSPYLNYNSLQNDFRANADYHNATRIGGTTQLIVTPSDGHVLTFGVDGGLTKITSNFLLDRTLDDGAVFGQYDLRLAEPLKVVAGGRLDYHKATGGEAETSFSPKFGMVVKASDHVSLRASVGRGYRAPSAIEQFVNTVQFGFRVVPNPTLKGEHAWAGEVGVTATRGRFWADGSVFQSSYRDLISPGAATGQPFGTYQFLNLDRARVRGFDAGVRVRPLPNLLDLQATYLFLDARDLVTDTALVYRSKHTITGTADLLSGLVGVDLRYRSRPETVLQFQSDPRTAITVVDLRVGYRLLGTGLQLKISNLLQAHYANVQERIPGAPRNVSLTAYRGF
jgi:outer membrane receptor protein involved in Fe transport